MDHVTGMFGRLAQHKVEKDVLEKKESQKEKLDQIQEDMKKQANDLLGIKRATFEGYIDILVIEAHGLQDCDGIFRGKSDPYVSVFIDAEHKGKTSVCHNDPGSDPVWNEGLVFDAEGTYDELSFHVLDRDRFSKDDILGTCTISAKKLFKERVLEGTFPLKFPKVSDIEKTKSECKLNKKEDEEELGTIILRVEYHPPRFEGRLTIRVIECNGLINTDDDGFKKGKSDPYVKITLDKETLAETTVVKDDLDPHWNEEFNVAATGEHAFLYLAVYDKDRLSRDDSLGFHRISTRDIIKQKDIQGTSLLTAPTDVEGNCGNIKYSILYTPPTLHGELQIKVQKATHLADADLIGKSDPYCVVALDDKEYVRTKTINNNLDPEWNEDFVTVVTGKADAVVLSVYDADRKHDTLLGTVKVGVEQLLLDKVVEGTYALKPTPGQKRVKGTLSRVKGSLTFSLKYTPKKK